MRTRLLAKIGALPDDAAVLAALELEALADPLGGTPYLMGIRNRQGRVYREVQAQGAGEKVRLVQALQRLDFIEEQHPAPVENGYRSTFSRYRNGSVTTA